MLGISFCRPWLRVVPKTNPGILTALENCSAFLGVLRGPSSRTSRLKAFLRDACRTGDARLSKEDSPACPAPPPAVINDRPQEGPTCPQDRFVGARSPLFFSPFLFPHSTRNRPPFALKFPSPRKPAPPRSTAMFFF